MEYFELLESRQEPNIVEIIEQLREDQSERSTWDTATAIGWRIRNSLLPIQTEASQLKNYKGVYYKDNWVLKSGKWLTSYLTGADVYADVKSFDGIITPNMEIVENETNFAKDITKMEKNLAPASDDCFYTGIGVVQSDFNTRKINAFWKTGTPQIDHVDSRNVWFKRLGITGQNIEHIFVAEPVNTKNLKEMVAKYSESDSKLIVEDNDGAGLVQFPKIKGQTIVYNFLHKETTIVPKREFIHVSTDYATGEEKKYTWFEIEEEWQNSGFTEEDLLERNIFIADDPVEVEVDLWYKVRFIASANLIIKQYHNNKWKESVLVGDSSGYHFLFGNPVDGSSYPTGQAYDMADILDLSVIFMSSLAKQIGTMNKPQPQVFREAIKDYNEFVNNHWKSDYILEFDEEFFSDPKNKHLNPQDVVTYKQTPINDRLFLVMQNYIAESIKTQTGAIDSARGEQSYSGQSGVLAQELQNASQTFLEADVDKYRDFLDSILNWLMNTIVKYRQFPHDIKGLDEDGKESSREVNTTEYNTLKAENYYIEAQLEPNAEVKKRANKEMILKLLDSGRMPLRQALEVLDIPSINTDRVMDELNKERGIEQIVEAMEKYPEAQGQIMQMIQQIAGQFQGTPKGA